MKDLRLLVWITQLGISVAAPIGGFLWLANWLHTSCGWGKWVIVAGAVLGVICAIDGLRTSLKAMLRMSRAKKDDPVPTVSFNDHQ